MDWEEQEEMDLVEPVNGWRESRGAPRRQVDALGRPLFGAQERTRIAAGNGKIEYEGPQAGGVILGLAALWVLLKLAQGKN